MKIPKLNKKYGGKGFVEQKRGLSSHGLPKRSPTLVLTMPEAAQLRSSDGIRCFRLSLDDSKSQTTNTWLCCTPTSKHFLASSFSKHYIFIIKQEQSQISSFHHQFLLFSMRNSLQSQENAVSVSIKHFITLLILMKGGTSQYSRPTTAKKGLPSPKILKKPEERTKVKTQQNDIDANKLYELIEQAIARQKDCESRGKYVEAEGFKRKVKMLKEQLQDREMQQIQMRHEEELRQLQQAHLAQMNLFDLQWQKQINDFNNQIDRMLAELAQKHQKQMKEAENDLDVQRKFHQSPKLLELRRIQQELGRQENYMQAHKIQLKANKLQKEEMEKHKIANTQKSKTNLKQLRAKQENQAQALKMRIRLQVEQRQRNRLNEQAKLRQKYENILKETEFQQNQELIRLNKAVKLNQLQKKSKVGMFSYSKDGLS